MIGYGRFAAIETAGDDNADNRRVRNRINCVLLECELGEVVNLSLTGMRVRCHKKVAPPPPSMQPIRVTLRVADKVLELKARIAWSRKVGAAFFSRYEMGCFFIDVSEEQRAAIGRLAREAADCEIVRPRE